VGGKTVNKKQSKRGKKRRGKRVANDNGTEPGRDKKESKKSPERDLFQRRGEATTIHAQKLQKPSRDNLVDQREGKPEACRLRKTGKNRKGADQRDIRVGLEKSLERWGTRLGGKLQKKGNCVHEAVPSFSRQNVKQTSGEP